MLLLWWYIVHGQETGALWKSIKFHFHCSVPSHPLLIVWVPMLAWPMISTIVIHAIASTINRRSVAEWVLTNYFGSSRISEISIALECWFNRSRPHCIDLTWAYFVKRVNLAFNANNHTIFPTLNSFIDWTHLLKHILENLKPIHMILK
jgi:hypothetical protein